MAHFILQTFSGKIEHDFVFQLQKSLDYINWFYREKVHTYEFSEIPIIKENSFPVGDLLFVFNSLVLNDELNKEKRKPINIPDSLNFFNFTKRETRVSDSPFNPFLTNAFVKSNSVYKSFTDIIQINEKVNIKDSSYFFSEEKSILSEWRVFVLHSKIVGLQNYAGDFFLFPSNEFLLDIVHTYTDSPNSYSFDIAINEDELFLIEVHPFVSCGLYGFSDLKLLPTMFIEGINFLKK